MILINQPDKESALQFALMLQAGMPSLDAVRYFLPDDCTEASARQQHDAWMKSKLVQDAFLALQGKPWQDMSLEERITYAINKHYGEMAYFLYSRNYAEMGPQDRQKADICRNALEARQAGVAGKQDSLTRFFDDLKRGSIKLGAPMTALPA